MKTFIKFTMTAVAILGIASAAVADNHPQKAVMDERDNVVFNTFDNCVVTKWEGTHDECSGGLDISQEARTVYFDFDRAALTPAAKAKLDSLVDIIKNSTSVESVTIVGFADRIGNAKYNYRLSERRAKAVQDHLAAQGYYDTRSTEVRALGDTQPISECEGIKGKKELRACLWRDRRVEIELNFSK